MASSGSNDRDHKLLMALRHPLRRAILWVMSNDEPISPSQLAELLGQRLTNVSYHVKVLARCGAIAPAGNEQVRGATQHFYRWSLKEEWAQRMLEASEDTPPLRTDKPPKGKGKPNGKRKPKGKSKPKGKDKDKS
jgi:DNA-binding transcriptional ArsR family regulator